MEQSNIITKTSYSFFLIWIAFLVSGIIFTFFYPKGMENVLLNGLHTPFLDSFFYYLTYLGDGLFCVAATIILLFFSFKKAIWLSICYLSSSIITQVLKHVFNTPRPKLFLQDFNLLHQVADVQIYTTNSFPSGHSTSAFALAFILTYFSTSRLTGLILGTLAVLAALSRIYLLQHFLIDILVGSIIGVCISALVCSLLNKSAFNQKQWLNSSFLTLKDAK